MWWIKSLVPVYRFFESGEIVPQLQVRTSENSDFKIFLQPIHLQARHLIHAPQVAEALFNYSLVSQLTTEVLANGSPEKSEAFQKLKPYLLNQSSDQFQFRIINLKSPQGSDPVFCSDWMTPGLSR
jgi:hypothetical protein